ncbi:MAG: YceD family protein [Myxococcota bacterium]
MRIRLVDAQLAARKGGLRIELASEPALATAVQALVPTCEVSGVAVRFAAQEGGELTAELDGSINHVFPCGRCGADVPGASDMTLSLTYLPPEEEGGEEERELSEADLDVGWHDGQGIDAVTVVAEAVMLTVPEYVLCGRKGCLEPREVNDPKQPTGHPAFASLGSLLDRKTSTD